MWRLIINMLHYNYKKIFYISIVALSKHKEIHYQIDNNLLN